MVLYPLKEKIRAIALSAGMLIEKLPESLELVPLCCPRIEMVTPAKGDSFSSSTFPLMVAGLFCAKQKTEVSKVMDRIKQRRFIGLKVMIYEWNGCGIMVQ
jgi:hypothetical protein